MVEKSSTTVESLRAVFHRMSKHKEMVANQKKGSYYQKSKTGELAQTIDGFEWTLEELEKIDISEIERVFKEFDELKDKHEKCCSKVHELQEQKQDLEKNVQDLKDQLSKKENLEKDLEKKLKENSENLNKELDKIKNELKEKGVDTDSLMKDLKEEITKSNKTLMDDVKQYISLEVPGLITAELDRREKEKPKETPVITVTDPSLIRQVMDEIEKEKPKGILQRIFGK